MNSVIEKYFEIGEELNKDLSRLIEKCKLNPNETNYSELIHVVFRLKGMYSRTELRTITSVLYDIEKLLEKLREKKLIMNDEISEELDYAQALLQNIYEIIYENKCKSHEEISKMIYQSEIIRISERINEIVLSI